MKRKYNKFLSWTLGSFNAVAVFAILFLQPHNFDGEGGTVACCGGGLVFFIVFVFGILLPYVCLWKIFVKAGKPGWAAIIPIYNLIILCEIVGRPTIWVVYCLIPVVNIVCGIILLVDLVKSFEKEPVWVLGLLFLPVIFYPMLAFGSSEYKGPSYSQPAPPSV